jgi:chromosome segregation ATPase
MNGIALVVALAGVLVAVALFLAHRGARAELAAARKRLEALEAEAAETGKAASSARADAKERREEASALRAELKEVKKKAFDQAEAARKAGGAPALREELDKVAARLAEARAEAEHQGVRSRTLEAELEKARAALERKARAEAAPPPPAPAPVPAAPAAPDEGGAAEKARLEAERADRAEAKLAEAKKRVTDLEAEARKARGRLETERRVYVVQKGELDLAHDRYAELRRRHDQLKKDYDELVEAVRQAAREERRSAGPDAPEPGGAETPG